MTSLLFACTAGKLKTGKSDASKDPGASQVNARQAAISLGRETIQFLA
ncbi:hypothetical protein ACO0LF_15730 [Undibacterium sp. Di27W]